MNMLDIQGTSLRAPPTHYKRSGKLYYVIGPSGAGKDSLIDSVRARFPNDLIVAHRYITRVADAGGENHVALTIEEFHSRQSKGLFALHWQAHGFEYGIGREVIDWLSEGFSVVANGSRAELSQARRRFGVALVPIVVQVNQPILRQRLIARARETEQEIECRLQRALQYVVPENEQVYIIDNSGNINDSLAQFSLLRLELETGEIR